MNQAQALANLLVAATPGGIERQEKQGQAQFVAAEELPIKFNGHDDGREILEKLGFKFGKEIDDLFVEAALPEGWTKQATDHSMWSKVLDERGRERLSIFYKAAFYDRDAFINICRRFRISQYDSCDANGNPCDEDKGDFHQTVVRDWNGAAVFVAGHCASGDWKAHDALRDTARAWLDEHYPDWKKCDAHWELP
jgi:hypothetical protein